MLKFIQALMAAALFVAILSIGSAQAQEPDATPALSGLDGGRLGQVTTDDLRLVYQWFGPETGETILLIQGTGAQLVDWPLPLIESLVAEGYGVLTFDNRDAGQSTHLEEAGPPDWLGIFTALAAGEPLPVAYTPREMVQDAVGLLDALDIDSAHIVGASGGAIIAQVLAAERPQRVQSLTLLMANSGNPAYPVPANPERMATVPPVAPPSGSPLDAIVDYRVRVEQALGGSDNPVDEDIIRAHVMRSVERAYDPVAADRQGAAMLAVPHSDMRLMLESIAVPTIVIHGDSDPLLPWQLGEDVANTIPDAEFVLIEGMGHNLPEQHIPQIAGVIVNIARQAG